MRAGKFQAGEFMRITKDGSEIWIQAAYNPVLDAAGKPFKVVKNAVDITATKKEQRPRRPVWSPPSTVSAPARR